MEVVKLAELINQQWVLYFCRICAKVFDSCRPM